MFTRKKKEINQNLHEAIDGLHLARVLLQGIYDSNFLLTSNDKAVIEDYLKEVNSELCGLDVLISKFGMVDLKSCLNNKVSLEELNKPVE